MPLNGLLHPGEPIRKLKDSDWQFLGRLLRKSPMDGRDTISSNEKEGHGVETVSRHLHTTDKVVLLEEDRLEGLRSVWRPHHDMRRFCEAPARKFLAREFGIAPDDCTEFFLENDLERMLPRAEFLRDDEQIDVAALQ